MWSNNRYLALGVALTLPFLIANILVASQVQLFLALLRPHGQTTSYEHMLVFVLIALVGMGGLVTLLPIITNRRLYVVNLIVGALLVVFAVFLGYGIGVDVYHCDILQIPNCD